MLAPNFLNVSDGTISSDELACDQTTTSFDEVAGDYFADWMETAACIQVPDGFGGYLMRYYIDDPDAPRILCAPEESWAAVNVRALSVDSPQPDVLKKRVIKEAWRSLSIALGASDTMYRPCLLSPTHTLADLDANVSLVVSPEPFSKMMGNAEALGICRVRHTTYRKACYEGWAPPPTNEYQKAIWDMVHALPTEPMKIKPEAKKVSG